MRRPSRLHRLGSALPPIIVTVIIRWLRNLERSSAGATLDAAFAAQGARRHAAMQGAAGAIERIAHAVPAIDGVTGAIAAASPLATAARLRECGGMHALILHGPRGAAYRDASAPPAGRMTAP